MDTSKRDVNLRDIKSASDKSHVGDAASALLSESQKKANELYQQGLDKLGVMEDQVMEYSDKLLLKVKENPFSAILIAAGAGYLLSKLLK